jgi:hypothetical protein
MTLTFHFPHSHLDFFNENMGAISDHQLVNIRGKRRNKCVCVYIYIYIYIYINRSLFDTIYMSQLKSNILLFYYNSFLI